MHVVASIVAPGRAVIAPELVGKSSYDVPIAFVKYTSNTFSLYSVLFHAISKTPLVRIYVKAWVKVVAPLITGVPVINPVGLAVRVKNAPPVNTTVVQVAY